MSFTFLKDKAKEINSCCIIIIIIIINIVGFVLGCCYFIFHLAICFYLQICYKRQPFKIIINIIDFSIYIDKSKNLSRYSKYFFQNVAIGLYVFIMCYKIDIKLPDSFIKYTANPFWYCKGQY